MTTLPRGQLVVLGCHGVYDIGNDVLDSEHPEDRPVYQAQLRRALDLAEQRSDSCLVLSGGPTKPLDCSESRSYRQWAEHLGWRVDTTVLLEEFALTSVENLLLSLYRYHQEFGAYPESVSIVSWEFKRRRFLAAGEAIHGWPSLPECRPPWNFEAEGDLVGQARAAALGKEEDYVRSLKNGLEDYFRRKDVRALIQRRDPHGSRQRVRKCYQGYPLPW